MTKMCSNCGTENPLGAKTCKSCGKAIRRPVIWPVLFLLLFPVFVAGQTLPNKIIRRDTIQTHSGWRDTVQTAGKGLSADPSNLSFLTVISPKDYKRHNLIVFRPDTLTMIQIYTERDTLKVKSSLPLDKSAEYFFYVLYKSWLEVVTTSKFGKDSK